MGRTKITYYQVRCDYPTHEGARELYNGCTYHLMGDYIVCNGCWANKLVVETLLECLNQHHEVLYAGREK